MQESHALTNTVVKNTEDVRYRINEAARRAGRDPQSICLLAVAKKFPLTHIRAAVDAGIQHIGENRVQEAVEKITKSAHLPLTWHMVGHLQSNKAIHAVSSFSWIHSVDSVELLLRLNRLSARAGTRPNLLVQVALANESTKHGVPVDTTQRIFEAAGHCHNVKVKGLMVLPPQTNTAEEARPFFRQVRKVRDRLVELGIKRTMLGELSMGMSGDFEVAVEEGATIIRVGTGIFGPRPRPEA